jgi:hypothetical protein
MDDPKYILLKFLYDKRNSNNFLAINGCFNNCDIPILRIKSVIKDLRESFYIQTNNEDRKLGGTIAGVPQDFSQIFVKARITAKGEDYYLTEIKIDENCENIHEIVKFLSNQRTNNPQISSFTDDQINRDVFNSQQDLRTIRYYFETLISNNDVISAKTKDGCAILPSDKTDNAYVSKKYIKMAQEKKVPANTYNVTGENVIINKNSQINSQTQKTSKKFRFIHNGKITLEAKIMIILGILTIIVMIFLAYK